MKALVQHLLRSNREEILKRSLMNCHARGLHSIMLLECPGKTIRLFVAEPGHELECNSPLRFHREQTIAFHAHHCDVTLAVTRGWILNVTARLHDEAGWGEIVEYRHRSAISKGAIGFDRLSTANLTWSERRISRDESVFMPAEQIHTVACPTHMWAAWLVFEGRENPKHDNRCWSFSPLDGQDFSHLYQPMSEPDLLRLLHEAHLL